MKLITMLSLMAVTASSFATDLFWNGDTTGSATYNRPSSLSTLSAVGTAVNYTMQEFNVSITGNYVLEAFGTGHPDTYIFLYANSFSPASSLTNLMNGDDDYTGAFSMLPGSGSGLASSRIATGDTSNYDSTAAGSLLVAGTNYFMVVAGFSNGDQGTFNAAIGGGQGNVMAGPAGSVPEPASLAVLGLGAVALIRRRKKA